MATLKNTTVNDTGFLEIPAGTTAERPSSPVVGDFRYNTDDSSFEVYTGTTWSLISSGGGSGAVSDLSTIRALNTMKDIAYFPMPSGPRTLLNYTTSFGVDQNSNNTNSSAWQNGFDTNGFTYIDTGGYFLSGNAVFVNGDGSADAGDWVVWNFGPLGGGDFNPAATQSGRAFFGGEFQDGASNGGYASKGYVWGFGSSGWQLLFELTLPGSTFNVRNSTWWNAGSTVTSGDGKRAEYDSYNIDYIGFSVA